MDYYTLFELSPQMSFSEIRARLTQAARLYGGRANSAPRLEDRHQAERMLPLIAEAEATLLSTSRRSAYDAEWRERAGGSPPPLGAPASASRLPSRSQARPAPELRQEPDDKEWTAPARRPHREDTVPALPERCPGTASADVGIAVLRGWFGWTTVHGTVVHMDPMYTIPPPVNWTGVLFAVILAPLVVFLVILLLGFWLATAILFPRFARSLHVMSLPLMVIAFCRNGNRPAVPVRDLRLRDRSGDEHGVRMTGRFVTGSVNVGDDVTLSGFSNGGTLKAWWGMNHRTRSRIRVQA